MIAMMPSAGIDVRPSWCCGKKTPEDVELSANPSNSVHPGHIILTDKLTIRMLEVRIPK